MKELVDSVKASRPDLFDASLTEKSAVALLEAAFKIVGQRLSKAEEGQQLIEGLGRFRIRNVARNNGADPARIIRYTPASTASLDTGSRKAPATGAGTRRPELILHAGAHKTGTTAIQAFAHRNRSALLARNVLYPDLGELELRDSHAHHVFAHAIAGMSKYGSPQDARKLADIWKDAASTSGIRLLVSAEPVFRHLEKKANVDWLDRRRRYLTRLAEILSGFDVTVIIVLRRQDSFIRSLYQEHVMKGTSPGQLSFAAFREGRARFRDNLALFEELFPRLKALVYEDFPRGDRFCEHFFAAIGVDVSGLPGVGIVRESLSPSETMVKQFLNPLITSLKENRAVLAWIQSAPVQKLLHKHFGESELDLWESWEARSEYLSGFDSENKEILERYFPGRERLFPSLEKKEARAPLVVPEKLKRDLLARLESDPEAPRKIRKAHKAAMV